MEGLHFSALLEVAGKNTPLLFRGPKHSRKMDISMYDRMNTIVWSYFMLKGEARLIYLQV